MHYLELLISRNLYQSFPNSSGFGFGSVCKNPELIDDAWVKAPMVSLSNKVTSYLPVFPRCHAVERPVTPPPITAMVFLLPF